MVNNTTTRKDILGNEINCDCIGCAITKGDLQLPGGVIYNGESIILGADPEIPIPGFLVITSKRHINSFSELSRQERTEIGDVIANAEMAIKGLGISTEITLVQEERSEHFHIWIFPTYDWMTEKFGKGISKLRDICSYARENANDADRLAVIETAGQIREYLAGKL